MDENELRTLLGSILPGLRDTVNELVVLRVAAATQASSEALACEQQQLKELSEQAATSTKTVQDLQATLLETQELVKQLNEKISGFETSVSDTCRSYATCVDDANIAAEKRVAAAHAENLKKLDECSDSITARVLKATDDAVETKVQAGIQVLLDRATVIDSALADQVSASAVEAASKSVPIQVEAALVGLLSVLEVPLFARLKEPLAAEVTTQYSKLAEQLTEQITAQVQVQLSEYDSSTSEVLPSQVEAAVVSMLDTLKTKVFDLLAESVVQAVKEQTQTEYERCEAQLNKQSIEALDAHRASVLEALPTQVAAAMTGMFDDLQVKVLAQIQQPVSQAVKEQTQVEYVEHAVQLSKDVADAMNSHRETTLEAMPAQVEAAVFGMLDVVQGKVFDQLRQLVLSVARESATEANEALREEVRSALQQSIEQAAEAAIGVADKSVPDLVEAQISAISDAVIERSSADLQSRVLIYANERIDAAVIEVQKVVVDAASEGAKSTIEVEVPILVEKCVHALEKALFESATEQSLAACSLGVAESLNDFVPLITEQMSELASQITLRAATSVVTDLVAAQADELASLVANRAAEQATEAATRAAVQAGEASGRAALADVISHAQKVATEVAESTGAASARVTTEALIEQLRTALVQELDPSHAIEAQVKQAIDSMSTHLEEEFGAAISAATDKHIADELPRVEIGLIAKLHSAIERIPAPKDGKDGKNARVLAPVPWEKATKYKMGAWVAHSNGIWVAARSWTDTEPSAGNLDWDCVVPGIKSIELVQEDDRVVNLTTVLSDGTARTHEIVLNIPVVRGVYSDTYVYTANDIATFDGSWWLAKKSGALARPGVNADEWKLQIKHGRDGKSAEVPNRSERYKGEWKPASPYFEGDVVQHGGWRWLAMRSTREQPLRSDDSWSRMGEGA